MKDFRRALVLSCAAGALVLGCAGAAAADETEGAAIGSPGVLSGNNIQVPIHIPINLCGDSIDIIGLLNPAAGNICVNEDDHHDNHHDDHHMGEH
jgi:hypothetical protein